MIPLLCVSRFRKVLPTALVEFESISINSDDEDAGVCWKSEYTGEVKLMTAVVVLLLDIVDGIDGVAEDDTGALSMMLWLILGLLLVLVMGILSAGPPSPPLGDGDGTKCALNLSRVGYKLFWLR